MKPRALAVLFVASCVAACRGKANEEECARMMDHYVDLAVADDPDFKKLTKEQLAVVREMKRELKRGERGYRKVHDACDRVSKKEFDCAMDTKTAEAWEACIE